MTQKLQATELQDALNTIPEWTYDTETRMISRAFKFKNFREAFGFMTQAALLAEKADHHPDWSNVYNRVDINLTTHDAGGLTTKDIDMAHAIDAL